MTADPSTHALLRAAATAAADAVGRAAATPGPVAPLDREALAAAIEDLDPCPDDGIGTEAALAEAGDLLLANGVRPADPLCAAHLQCPTLIPSAAAELAIGATNQSLDSFDQAPAATLAEDRLVRWLAGLLRLGTAGSGVLTAGGSASNLLGLLLARDRAARLAGGDPRRDGLPAARRTWRILASEAAHDSLRRAAATLGLGTGAVVPVAVDGGGAIDVAALDRALAGLAGAGLRPICLVGTAGTTDLGAIDPLDALADRAAAAGAWLHVDAAVGAAFALSERLRPRLDGIGRADSVTADLHKLWWQPVGASALLVRDAASFAAVHHASDYLNRADDEADGVLNLVGRSLDTSRRFDALKALVSMRAVGRRAMAAMVERVVDLAAHGGAAVAADRRLELVAPPATVTVVFRWNPPALALPQAEVDAANAAAQRRLFASGRAVVGRTRVGGAVALKLTLVNPLATPADVEALLDLAAAEAQAAHDRRVAAV
ncbi:MAG: aspartate aminotransferase family protein [Thermoleophilia bacterium]